MGFFLLGVGLILNFVFGIWIIVAAFRVSVGWGLAVIFLPFAGLIFVINHWQETKKPFLGGIASGVLMIMGVFILPDPEIEADAAETQGASRSTPSGDDEDGEKAPATNYASVAAPAAPSYQPRDVYQPAITYTPAYNPPAQPAPVATDTQAVEDEWARKPKFEQVYVDRSANVFYAEKCKKRPENAYRIPRSVAVMQGLTEAACR